MRRDILLYIAGPMTGLPEFNAPAFRDAAGRYTEAGFVTIDPSTNFGGRTDLPPEVYMRRDLRDVLGVDAVVMLEGWRASVNATLERDVARAVGAAVFDDAAGHEGVYYHRVLRNLGMSYA